MEMFNSCLTEGWEKVTSSKLPIVTALAVFEFFFRNERFTLSECRSVKASRLSNEVYGDISVGYVQLKRSESSHICQILALVCPEHRVTSRNYRVSVEVNERQGDIIEGTCHGCAASKGGCRHLIVFIMWLHHRSEESPTREVKCYWQKSVLWRVGSAIKFNEVEDLVTNRNNLKRIRIDTVDNENSARISTGSIQNIVEIDLKENCNSELQWTLNREHRPQLGILQMHFLMYAYENLCHSKPKEFIEFCSKAITVELCEQVSTDTVAQSMLAMWFKMRIGRITASRLHEAAQCRKDGTLVQVSKRRRLIVNSFFYMRLLEIICY